MSPRFPLVLSALFLALTLGGCAPSGPEVQIVDPYAEVDWSTFGQYKADFHVHTNQSDGKLPPPTLMDKYRAAGFKVLAITDHNKVTYPWTEFGRDPREMGMVAVQGCELSIHHHMNSLFVDTSRTLSEKDALFQVGAKGGLIIFNHPYWTPDGDGKPADWYIEFFCRYNHLIGVETADPSVWDACLTRLMPDRPIWGFLNSDTHEGPLSVWSIMLLPSLDQAQVKRALEKGHFYSCAIGKSKFSPTVQSVQVDRQSATITIRGRDHGKVVWIANGKHVYEGESFDCRTLPPDVTYVRAELIPAGGGAVTRLNPFGIVRKGRPRVKYPAQGQAYWAAKWEKECRESRERIRKNWNDAYPLAARVSRENWRTLDLSAAANRPLTGPEGWLGKAVPGGLGSLYHIAPGRRVIHGVPFEVIGENANDGKSVVCLQSKTFPTSLGKANPPFVTVPVGARCEAVYVLHGAAYISKHEKIGRYRFVYEDGTSQYADVVALGKGADNPAAPANIQDWWPGNRQFSGQSARQVIVAPEANPLDVRYMYTLQWRNPHPEKFVKEIELASESEGKAGLMVLSVTAQLSRP